MDGEETRVTADRLAFGRASPGINPFARVLLPATGYWAAFRLAAVGLRSFCASLGVFLHTYGGAKVSTGLESRLCALKSPPIQ